MGRTTGGGGHKAQLRASSVVGLRGELAVGTYCTVADMYLPQITLVGGWLCELATAAPVQTRPNRHGIRGCGAMCTARKAHQGPRL